MSRSESEGAEKGRSGDVGKEQPPHLTSLIQSREPNLTSDWFVTASSDCPGVAASRSSLVRQQNFRHDLNGPGAPSLERGSNAVTNIKWIGIMIRIITSCDSSSCGGNLRPLTSSGNFAFASAKCGCRSLLQRTRELWGTTWLDKQNLHQDCRFIRGAFDSAKNHKRQRRKRQSVTAKREKSQTPKFV